MVFLDIGLNPLDDSGGPVDDKALKPVLLVEIGVHKLLHRLHRELALSALDVVFDLLLVDVVDDILELLQGDDLRLLLSGDATEVGVLN
jgi:hypothetical protein